ncbi:MAG: ATP-binding cassette domain-containing protein [Sheuella sp.]|nr:ATP-binding cassette domain-containing protein [Sheuella sp.]
MANAAIIDVEDLTTAFGTHVVHEHLNLQVFPKEILALVGGSGSGKTTLLRQILGLDSPRSGEVKVFGRPVHDYIGPQRIALTHRWGMLFQAGALFSALPVFDNVALPLREIHHLPEDLIRDVVLMRLSWMGLTSRDAALMPSDLSGGMVKRVALARALALDPELLFLDEPTAGLDPQRADEFCELIKTLHAELGFTVVMVTHDLDTIGALATRVAVLAEKKVLVEGTIDQVMQTKHPFIESFFHGERGVRALGQFDTKDVTHGKP